MNYFYISTVRNSYWNGYEISAHYNGSTYGYKCYYGYSLKNAIQEYRRANKLQRVHMEIIRG